MYISPGNAPARVSDERTYRCFCKSEIIGKPLSFKEDHFAGILEGQVKELNEFFVKQKLRGGSHHGYVRVFNNGDNPRFHWNIGGGSTVSTSPKAIR